MKVIEQFLESKVGNPEACEDGIFISDAYVAIVDGATSKSPKLWDGKKSGRIARDLVLSKIATLAPDLEAVGLMQALDAGIRDWYEAQGVTELMAKTPVERPSASAIVYSVRKHELWFLGDCQALVDGRHLENTKRIDAVSDNARAAFLEAELFAGKTVAELQAHDTGRDYIMPILERQNYFQNRQDSQFGYPVLDGFFTGWGVRVESVKDAREIVLASDGYPELKATLAESEAALSDVLAEDPLLFRRYLSPKGLTPGALSYDDRAYVRFVL